MTLEITIKDAIFVTLHYRDHMPYTDTAWFTSVFISGVDA